MNCNVTEEGYADEEVKKPLCHFHLLSVTFEHRHENKSCSACRERVNERVFQVCQVFNNIKTLEFLVPSFCLTLRHF